MKKLFFAVLLSTVVALSSFAAGTKISSKVTYNFKTEYTNATDVTWKAADSYVQASFTLDNQRMEVFYNFSGDKIGSSQTISLEELPVNAKRAFAKRYSDYTVTEAIRFDGNDESAYYIAARNEKSSVILKVGASNLLSTYKIAKNQ